MVRLTNNSLITFSKSHCGPVYHQNEFTNDPPAVGFHGNDSYQLPCWGNYGTEFCSPMILSNYLWQKHTQKGFFMTL